MDDPNSATLTATATRPKRSKGSVLHKEEQTVGDTLDQEDVQVLIQTWSPETPGRKGSDRKNRVRRQNSGEPALLSASYPSLRKSGSMRRKHSGAKRNKRTASDLTIDTSPEQFDGSDGGFASWADSGIRGVSSICLSSPLASPRGETPGGHFASAKLAVREVTEATSAENRLERVGPYLLKATVGRGAYGAVVSALNVDTGRKHALKMFDKAKLSKKQLKMHAWGEASILSLVQGHPSVLTVDEVLESSRHLVLVLELVEHGINVETLVRRCSSRLSLFIAKRAFRSLVEALSHCHSLGVAHRDVKPQNMLFDVNSGETKLIDFGFATTTHKSEILSEPCGSPHYVAPEVCSRDAAYEAFASDIWSAGATLYELLTLHAPFDRRRGTPSSAASPEAATAISDCAAADGAATSPLAAPMQVNPRFAALAGGSGDANDEIGRLLHNIQRGAYDRDRLVAQPAEASHLIGRMLTVDPVRRISMEEVLVHPFIFAQEHARPETSNPSVADGSRTHLMRSHGSGNALPLHRRSPSHLSHASDTLSVNTIGSSSSVAQHRSVVGSGGREYAIELPMGADDMGSCYSCVSVTESKNKSIFYKSRSLLRSIDTADKEQVRKTLNEGVVMERLGGMHISCVREVVRDSSGLWSVGDIGGYTGDSLEDRRLRGTTGFLTAGDSAAVRCAAQMATCVCILHLKDVTHNSLSLGAFRHDPETDRIVLTQFGNATLQQPSGRHAALSRRDVQHLGEALYLLLENTPCPASALADPPFARVVNPCLQNAMAGMLCPVDEKRWSAEQVLACLSPYYTNTDGAISEVVAEAVAARESGFVGADTLQQLLES